MLLQVGYIVMRDPSTGARTNLLRMKGAEVVGVYHPLIDKKLVSVLHRFGFQEHLADIACQLKCACLIVTVFCIVGDRRKKKVYAWTVDDEESMQNMLSEHVDAIITSNPTLLQGVMQHTRTRCLEEGYSLSH